METYISVSLNRIHLYFDFVFITECDLHHIYRKLTKTKQMNTAEDDAGVHKTVSTETDALTTFIFILRSIYVEELWI